MRFTHKLDFLKTYKYICLKFHLKKLVCFELFLDKLF